MILVNKETTSRTVNVSLKNGTPGARFHWYLLTGGTDNGEFSRRVFVNSTGPLETSAGPASEYATIRPYSATTQGGIKITLPVVSHGMHGFHKLDCLFLSSSNKCKG